MKHKVNKFAFSEGRADSQDVYDTIAYLMQNLIQYVNEIPHMQEAIDTVYELLSSSLNILEDKPDHHKANIKDMLQLYYPQNIKQESIDNINLQENIPENKDTSLEELKIIIDYFANIGVNTTNLILSYKTGESVCDMLERTKSNTLFSMCLVWYAYHEKDCLDATQTKLYYDIKKFMNANCKKDWLDHKKFKKIESNIKET